MPKRKADIAYVPLTDREWTVLQLVAEGLSNQEIAERLTLTLLTVKSYVKQIFNKLGADRRTQAVRLAQTLGLIEKEGKAAASPAVPVPLTPLVGREQEVAEVSRFLNDPTIRLVSIVGPSGIGKTHLALEIARQQTRRFPGPVCFIALDGVGAPSGVIPAVAGAIGFQFQGPLDPQQQLLVGLRGRTLLLVLDNFEHLLAAGGFVSEMLAAAPRLKILITSRERLHLRAETVFLLGGLAYLPEHDPAQEYPAFKVFMRAARRSQPDFQPGEEVNHISRICRLVEGMPLGLELAASWMAVLTPGQIADEIARRLANLQSTLQDLPERHRSIYAVFEHSWRLLSDEERMVFKKLSVFRGGFDRAAAGQVAGASLFMLSTLVDKSLVTHVGPDRFKLHELLRQCAEDKLRADMVEYRQTLQRHCQHYATVLQDCEKNVKTDISSSASSVVSMHKDFDNILAGWHLALDEPFPAEIGKYSFGLSLLLTMRTLPTIGEETFARARRLVQTHPVSPQDLMRVMTHYGWFLGERNKFDQARQVLEGALALAPQPQIVSDRSQMADIGLLLCFLGLTFHLCSQPDAGRERLQEALTVCQAADFQVGVALSLVSLGDIEHGEGRYVLAIHYFRQALTIFERAQELGSIAYVLTFLGGTCCALGDTKSARDYLRRGLEVNRPVLAGYPFFPAVLGIAALYERCGQPEVALKLLAIFLHHPQRVGRADPRARVLLVQFRARLPAEQIDAVMDKAKRGQLSSRYLDPQFIIGPDLTDRLLELLDQVPDCL